MYGAGFGLLRFLLRFLNWPVIPAEQLTGIKSVIPSIGEVSFLESGHLRRILRPDVLRMMTTGLLHGYLQQPL